VQLGLKRVLVGRPLQTHQLHETLLPKWLALPIFASDPLSSVAYATEEIVLVAALGGAVFLGYAKWVAIAIAALMAIVVLSYRQTCRAYPGGGGAFAVSLDNFGEPAALTAASALLVDYVMTVAVSIVAGVVAITSSAPSLRHDAVALSVAFAVILMVVNLRGVRESGRAFAIPTYAFVFLTFVMFAVAAAKLGAGHLPNASTADQAVTRTARTGGLFTFVLLARAFASGCTALTGVEAISNGVPAFRAPKARNAARTLAAMGIIAISMFAGITVLARVMNAHAQPDGNPSVISQVAAGVFGRHDTLFYLFQGATAAILVLAANTAFNGFPVLSSILAERDFLPRQLRQRGDKLVFSNGILLLGGCAIALIIGFDANIDKLIQLYIIGVFTSFTLSQAGMVRHWGRELRSRPTLSSVERRRVKVARIINAVGASATCMVLVVVIATKVPEGAWLAILAMGALFVGMKAVRRHYRQVEHEIALENHENPALPARNRAIVLVATLHLPALRAIAYAKATRPSRLEAVHVRVDSAATERLEEQWIERDLDIPLVVLDSPYREVTKPILEYVRKLRGASPRDVVTVFIPEYVVGRWWENGLHNQTALRLKARLLFEPGVMVTSVPWPLGNRGVHGGDGADDERSGELVRVD